MTEQHPEKGRGPSRRAVLTGAALTGAAGLAWAGSAMLGPMVRDLVDALGDGNVGPRPTPTAVPRASMSVFTGLAGSRFYYEVTGSPTRLAIEPAFANLLDASLRDHWTAAGWGIPARLSSYGTWIQADGDATSWHHEGRAFDVGEVRASDGRVLMTCRYDRWGAQSAPRRAGHERNYWRFAATLHRDFAHVLTYLFDEAHHNHIHVDNGRSGSGRSSFRPGSRVQVQAVQAMCRHVWGRNVEITGRWDGATRDATADVLEQAGIGGRLTAGDSQWHAFLSATARRA